MAGGHEAGEDMERSFITDTSCNLLVIAVTYHDSPAHEGRDFRYHGQDIFDCFDAKIGKEFLNIHQRLA